MSAIPAVPTPTLSSFIRSFFPLFRPSVLSPTPFPALIHEDSVLYNPILQSRAIVKAANFTSRLDAHIYIYTPRVHTKTRRRRKYVDFAISVTRLTAFYPNGKFPSCTKKPMRSRAARLPTSCGTCTLKSAATVERTSRTYTNSCAFHGATILRNFQSQEIEMIEKIYSLFFL